MPTILVVDADSDNSLRLQKAFEGAGYAVEVANSGSSAKTMIKRHRPDLIISQPMFEDMYGSELCSEVRADPATKGVMFVLFVDRRSQQMAHAASQTQADMILPDNLPPSTVVTRIDTHIRLRGLPAPPPQPTPAAAAPKASKEGPTATLQGSLAVMDLTEVTQAVAIGRKSGRLVFSLKGGQGVVVFDGGRVMHAEFGGKKGEQAFAALVMTAHKERGGSFSFIPIEAEGAAKGPQTINKDLETLLLNIAVEIDEQDRGKGR
ncbi:MAG TPA: DUF4388 domain-containing protein [Candidatus Methylomirabilis sp.]|nr:DUF4388 domain-containing protein [Candidatus Methylomirabilis sp.]